MESSDPNLIPFYLECADSSQPHFKIDRFSTEPVPRVRILVASYEFTELKKYWSENSEIGFTFCRLVGNLKSSSFGYRFGSKPIF